MRYEGAVYRPPSEARSLIIQTTIGCAHNRCTFCSMYKDKSFRIRSINEIFEDIETGRSYYRHVERIFLADGDALIMKTEDLKRILIRIREVFPECRRVGIYGAPRDILLKSTQELIELKDLGLGIVYLGIESGLDEILKKIKKGVSSEEIIMAGKKVKESGLSLSATLISGLGGRDNYREHAVESARVVSQINPDYLGLLTLMVEEGTELYDEVKSGEFKLLTPSEVMLETKLLLQNIKVSDCVFRSNHASNYVSLGGVLPKDMEEIMKKIDRALKNEGMYKGEEYRAL